jgi:dihydroneopterin aldolase
MDHIRLKDIIVYGYYGATGPERQIGQRLFMDLDLELDLSKPAETDSIHDTVSYEEVYLTAQHVAGGRRCQLIEHLGAQVIEGILQRFPTVQRVSVSLRKMNLPFPNTCREAEVLISRGRET